MDSKCVVVLSALCIAACMRADRALAGLKYQPGATEDEYLIPSSNDVDLIVPSLGIGYRFGRMEIDLATFYASGRRTSHGQESFDQDHVMVVAGLRWGS